MPNNKQPETLKSYCIKNIYKNIDRHWEKLKNGAQITKTIDDPESNFHRIKYILSPFEILDDQIIDFIIKKLYQNNLFNKSHLCICLHSHLKNVDLSFIRKKAFFSPVICNFIGNNCFNVVDLNLNTLAELSPKSICMILNSMKHLKRLNLSHTKANRAVTQLISTNCKKLESINLENCKLIYDDCVEDICDGLNQTLQYLNVDNIFLTDEIIEKVLNTCLNLKFFYVSELLQRISNVYNSFQSLDENQNQNKKVIRQYMIDTFYIDSDINLKSDKMEALTYSCPNLRQLRINCVGTNESLLYLNGFENLTELILANNCSLLSFKFGGYFVEALETSLGKKLKYLHLMYLTDINLRSIVKYCQNLIKLNIEFLGYYEPFHDKNLKDNDNLCVKSLRSISISNVSVKFEQIHLNIGQFKKDLNQLISNGQIKHLQLSCLNELDDEYFQCLFSLPTPKNLNLKTKHLFESIETMELKQMNCIGPSLITDYLLNNRENALKQLSLIDCKQIGKADYQKMSKTVYKNNLDCAIKWS